MFGCDSVVLPQDRVALRTWSEGSLDANGNLVIGCVLMGAVGELIVDPSFGTALKRGPDDISPVLWPPGFTGRRVGSEVEVLGRDRNPAARTGGIYEIFYTNVGYGSERGEWLFACGEVSTPTVSPALTRRRAGGS